MKDKSVLIPILLLLAGVAWRILFWGGPHPLTKSELMMDTVVTLTAYGKRDDNEQVLQQVFQAFKNVEEMASFHIPESELSKLNTERQLVPTPTFRRLLSAR